MESPRELNNWQTPHLHRLHVSLDTAFGPGSDTDGENGTLESTAPAP